MLIPLHCEYFALEGLADLMTTLRRVKAGMNPSLDVDGVLLTMYDERTNLGAAGGRRGQGIFQSKVFQTVIPRNVRLAEAPSHGMPVTTYDPKSRGADAYNALASEFLARAGKILTTEAQRQRGRSIFVRAQRSCASFSVVKVFVEESDGSWPALGKGLSALIPDVP